MGGGIAYLLTFSESGLALLKIVFQLQSLMETSRAQDEAKRQKAAELLIEMANCLGEIEKEIRSDTPELGRLVGKVRAYIEAFPSVFGPLIENQRAKDYASQFSILFEGEPQTYGRMIDGLLELKRFESEDAVDSAHVNASIATLTLVQGQLEALSELIQFPEAFRDSSAEEAV
ncbi:hypothetical protein GVY41_13730 [Frigidibacter albus]|uniref:Uncharacterized protein n=1 Tax=Frigidibacter albus TaxID=1465486 RepID=A0A6L8VI93_9RHOB|nr:hypothetical protein [Frigidibacter albus]MZQ90148.1 hypothetical protein [Frigidibacter albus]NBE32056.1 hypothetical protein [Frigidibacter albus]GGH57117.1 hypothetical protein GCM10011341_26250 [Frigidibacter albus]